MWGASILCTLSVDRVCSAPARGCGGSRRRGALQHKRLSKVSRDVNRAVVEPVVVDARVRVRQIGEAAVLRRQPVRGADGGRAAPEQVGDAVNLRPVRGDHRGVRAAVAELHVGLRGAGAAGERVVVEQREQRRLRALVGDDELRGAAGALCGEEARRKVVARLDVAHRLVGEERDAQAARTAVESARKVRAQVRLQQLAARRQQLRREGRLRHVPRRRGREGARAPLADALRAGGAGRRVRRALAVADERHDGDQRAGHASVAQWRSVHSFAHKSRGSHEHTGRWPMLSPGAVSGRYARPA
eukprot:938264-Prymnesium_polylepis.3